MTIETLLSRLDGVRETGYGKYIARCPAHDDKSPSLAIKECSDGRILINCFAGCDPADVLSAIGMTFSELMPKRIGNEKSYKPQRFDARQVLEGISHEIMVVVLITDRYSHLMTGDDESRLTLATGRITAGMNAGPPLPTPPENCKLRRGEFAT